MTNIKFEDLTMNNLKTKDLPIVMRMAKKLDLKELAETLNDVLFNEDVPETVVAQLEGKEEAEKADIINQYKHGKYVEVIVVIVNSLISEYSKLHKDIEELVASVYGLEEEDVSELDLDVMLECLYNLKEQEQLINFFKTALK